LTEKSSPKSIIGFTDTETVKLDFDDTSFRTATYWAFRAKKHFKLRGFIILKSSERCYHVVFDRVVSWSENIRVVSWVSLLSHCQGLQKYCLMQCIKMNSTLRVSHKREKSSPRIVFRYGKQDRNVKDFLKYRRIVKKIGLKLQNNRVY
jgi:hypothetical protein